MSNHYLSRPAGAIKTVTPDDSNDLPDGLCRSLLIGTAGNLKVTDASGNTVTIPVPVGYNPLQIRRVWSTSSTASNIFALY